MRRNKVPPKTLSSKSSRQIEVLHWLPPPKCWFKLQYMVVAEDSKATPEQVEFCAMKMEGSRRRFSLSHGFGSVIEAELQRYIEAYALHEKMYWS